MRGQLNIYGGAFYYLPALLCVGSVLSVYKLPNCFGPTSHHGSRVVNGHHINVKADGNYDDFSFVGKEGNKK